MKKNSTHHWWHVHNQATIGRPTEHGPEIESRKPKTATATQRCNDAAANYTEKNKSLGILKRKRKKLFFNV